MLGVICFTSDICLDWLCDYISVDAGTFSECFINLGGGGREAWLTKQQYGMCEFDSSSVD